MKKLAIFLLFAISLHANSYACNFYLAESQKSSQKRIFALERDDYRGYIRYTSEFVSDLENILVECPGTLDNEILNGITEVRNNIISSKEK